MEMFRQCQEYFYIHKIYRTFISNLFQCALSLCLVRFRNINVRRRTVVVVERNIIIFAEANHVQVAIYNSFYNAHTNEKVFGVNWITIKKMYIVITKGVVAWNLSFLLECLGLNRIT